MKKLYYYSNEYFYEQGTTIFDLQEKCSGIYIITEGVVGIELTDGVKSNVIDIMGRGSVIGIYGVLFREPWVYVAKSVSVRTTKILKISNYVLDQLAMSTPILFEHMDQFQKKLELNGIPQIDYSIYRGKKQNENLKIDRS